MLNWLVRLQGFKKLPLHFLLSKHYNKISNMSDLALDKVGMPLKDVVDALHQFADLSLAASWDNVGLLIEPTHPKLVLNALLTNDLTENVLQEAVKLKTDLIISYHPPLFKPIKSITSKNWKERIIATCLEHKIAVYSPHTTFDSLKGGVNDWLAAAFIKEIDSSKPIIVNDNGINGMGRLCTLKHGLYIDDAVKLVKQHTNLKYLRLARAYNTDGIINTVAVCAGSGTSVLSNVFADLYVTGEMLHHDLLDAIHQGTSVILTNHSDSERGYLKEFALNLGSILNNSVNVIVSETDSDPLKTV